MAHKKPSLNEATVRTIFDNQEKEKPGTETNQHFSNYKSAEKADFDNDNLAQSNTLNGDNSSRTSNTNNLKILDEELVSDLLDKIDELRQITDENRLFEAVVKTIKFTHQTDTYAWILRGSAGSIMLRGVTPLSGGSGRKDFAGTGRTHRLKDVAKRTGVDLSTLEKEVRAITIFVDNQLGESGETPETSRRSREVLINRLQAVPKEFVFIALKAKEEKIQQAFELGWRKRSELGRKYTKDNYERDVIGLLKENHRQNIELKQQAKAEVLTLNSKTKIRLEKLKSEFKLKNINTAVDKAVEFCEKHLELRKIFYQT